MIVRLDLLQPIVAEVRQIAALQQYPCTIFVTRCQNFINPVLGGFPMAFGIPNLPLA
jgi:hypothetical protein